MTPPSDDLQHLWNLDPGAGTGGTPDLLRHIEKTAKRFDRTIRFRDLRESVGGLLVAVIFGWMAFHEQTGLDRAADAWLAACGVWIMFYIRRYSKASRVPLPDQTLLGYQRDLLERYDRQIALLKSAKFWYILPFWIGLTASAVARFVQTGYGFGFGVRFFFVTALSLGLWWLNERLAVRYLQNERQQLMSARDVL